LENVGPDTPLRLSVAAAIAFPDQGISENSLRREAKRGRLTIEIIAGKTFTTLNEIERMRGRCRVEVRVPVSTSDQPATEPEKLTHQATWVVRDGTGYYATGCSERKVAAAEQVLKDYIAKKYAPTRKEQDLEKIPVADVLSIFIDDRPDLYVENSDAQKYLNRIGRLKSFGESSCCRR